MRSGGGGFQPIVIVDAVLPVVSTFGINMGSKLSVVIPWGYWVGWPSPIEFFPAIRKK